MPLSSPWYFSTGQRARSRVGYFHDMPLVEVVYGPDVADDQLRRLAQVLPDAVSLAVECPEEPYDHELQPGDVEIRFRGSGPYDVSGLDVVVEVRSKWFASRAENRQERCHQLCDAIVEAAGTRSVEVYMSLPVAGWAQGA
jgi:hypothetical protein